MSRGWYWLIAAASTPLGNGLWWLTYREFVTPPASWLISAAIVTAVYLVYGLFSPPCCRHCHRRASASVSPARTSRQPRNMSEARQLIREVSKELSEANND